MKRRGLTIIEVLVTLAITVVLVTAGMHALAAGLSLEQRLKGGVSEEEARAQFEDRLGELLSHAYLASDATDTASFFISGPVNGQAQLDEPLLGNSDGADELTFTTVGLRMSSALFDSEDDFHDLNTKYGPLGGKAEVNLSLSGFDAPEGREGLFFRVQRPADGDPSQGGSQSVLNAEVTEIRFEFYDGLEWQTAWDTRSQGTGRLPAAIRASYRLRDDEAQHIFTVRLVHSDATAENPVTIGGGP